MTEKNLRAAVGPFLRLRNITSGDPADHSEGAEPLFLVVTQAERDALFLAAEAHDAKADEPDPVRQVAEAFVATFGPFFDNDEPLNGGDCVDMVMGMVPDFRAALGITTPSDPRVAFLAGLAPGDEVTWTDPDDGACSRTLTIGTIEWLESSPNPIRDDEDVLRIVDTEGGELECFGRELS